MSSNLALELLRNNMNECYQSASRRHSQHQYGDAEVDVNTSEVYLDVSALNDLGTRHAVNLERPLGLFRDDHDEVVAETEAPVGADVGVCSDDDDSDDLADMLLTIDQLQPGFYCAALFASDNCWYRAKVKSVDGDTVQIVFIDYGMEAAIGIGDLRWLKERFTAAKMMSFQCCLEGWEETADTDDAAEQFGQSVLDRKLIADVLSVMTDEYKGVRYVVKLLDMGLSIGDRLKNPDNYKPMLVCVTTATSPWDFWCRCIDDVSVTTELPLLMDRIADLYSAGADDYQQHSDLQLDLDDEDMTYAARYTDGIWYRAKIISSHQSSTPTTVDVLFVDYGTKMEVLASDLRQLPENCRTLPSQAIHCRLIGIEPSVIGEQLAVWDDASMSRFVELVEERTFQLHPVSMVHSAQGDLVEISGRLLDGDKDVGAELVDSGYAVVASAGVKSGHLKHPRRSSSISEERCNLFVSFDAGSYLDNDTAAVIDENIVVHGDATKVDTDDVDNDVIVMGEAEASAAENVTGKSHAEQDTEEFVMADDGTEVDAIRDSLDDELVEADAMEKIAGEDSANDDTAENVAMDDNGEKAISLRDPTDDDLASADAVKNVAVGDDDLAKVEVANKMATGDDEDKDSIIDALREDLADVDTGDSMATDVTKSDTVESAVTDILDDVLAKAAAVENITVVYDRAQADSVHDVVTDRLHGDGQNVVTGDEDAASADTAKSMVDDELTDAPESLGTLY